MRPCPCCGNPNWYHLADQNEMSFSAPWEDKPTQYWNCRRCGLVTKDPKPTPGDLAMYYGVAWQAETPRPSECLASAAKWIQTRLEPYGTKEFGRAIDFGARTMDFLKAVHARMPIAAMQASDPQPKGPDVVTAWRGYPHDDPIEPTIRRDGPWTEGTHDFVSTTHVLEHVLDIHAFLEDITHDVSRDAGVLYIEVPALEGAGRYEAENIHRTHLWHFSLQSLHELYHRSTLREREFQVIGLETDLSVDGWPVNRLLLRRSDSRVQQHAHTHMFIRQLGEQRRAYHKAFDKIVSYAPEKTVLYGATEALMNVMAQAGKEGERLEAYRIVDLFKRKTVFNGRKVLCPTDEMWDPNLEVALVCTKNWNSVQDITRYVSAHFPKVKVVPLFD